MVVSCSSFALALAAGVVAALGPAAGSTAQCSLQWQRDVPIGGTDGPIHASVRWDPDGAGPRGEVVVFGGSFDVAGDVLSASVAAWDPITHTFARLSDGLVPQAPGVRVDVRVLAVDAAGGLLAAGTFGVAGSTCVHLARWTGAQWAPWGPTATVWSGTVHAMVAMPNGDVVVGGSMTVPGPGLAPVYDVVRWSAGGFQQLGSGSGSGVGSVLALARTPANDVVAGGVFSFGGGIARWNGSAWSPLGAGLAPGSVVRSVVVDPSGDVVVAGTFGAAGGVAATNVARWNGTAWSAVGGGLPDTVVELAALPSGALVAGTELDVFGAVPQVLRWNGTSWASIASCSGTTVETLTALPNDTFVAGGTFTVAGGAGGAHAVFWDGNAFVPLQRGGHGSVFATAVLPNGDLVVGGAFEAMDVPARHVARWDGGAWSSLGAGTDGDVEALVVLPNGDLVVGGRFDTAGNVPAFNVARWDGTSWSPLGAGVGTITEGVKALAVLPNGDLIAACPISTLFSPGLIRWDGTTWVPFASVVGYVLTLVVAPDGDLIAGGVFSSIGGVPAGSIARRTGTTWVSLSALPLPVPVRKITLAQNGDLLVAAAGTVQRWNGASWASLGTASVVATVAELPGGDVVAAGAFTSIHGVPAARVARRSAATGQWSPVAGGVNPGPVPFGVHDLRVLASDELLVTGYFSAAGGAGAAGIAKLSTTCPAGADPYGAGCSGAAGTVELAAETRPWLGAPFRTRATGLPAGALGVRVLGLAAVATPLAAITPLGGPACDLLASPDLLDAFVVAAPAQSLAAPIPADPALVGATFHQQVVVIELSAAGALVRFTSTNGVRATIGSW